MENIKTVHEAWKGEGGERGGGVKVKLSPLKLVEEIASPFWV